MDELVSIVEYNGKQAVNARDLYEALGVKKDFSDWIKGKIEKRGYVEGEGDDFFTRLVESTGGRPRKEYFLSVDMARDLAASEENEKGREVRRYLLAIERAYYDEDAMLKRAQQAARKRGGAIFLGPEIGHIRFLLEDALISPFPGVMDLFKSRDLPERVTRVMTSKPEGGRVYILRRKKPKMSRYVGIYGPDGRIVQPFITKEDSYGNYTPGALEGLERKHWDMLGKWGQYVEVQFTDYFQWVLSLVEAGSPMLLSQEPGRFGIPEVGTREGREARFASMVQELKALPPPEGFEDIRPPEPRRAEPPKPPKKRYGRRGRPRKERDYTPTEAERKKGITEFDKKMAHRDGVCLREYMRRKSTERGKAALVASGHKWFVEDGSDDDDDDPPAHF